MYIDGQAAVFEINDQDHDMKTKDQMDPTAAMALLDAKIRGLGPDKAVGARGFDNYSWHTDLPPGHPMVTGQQTVEFDLHAVEHAKTLVVWGMNWITTKMPDAHWLTEGLAEFYSIEIQRRIGVLDDAGYTKALRLFAALKADQPLPAELG